MLKTGLLALGAGIAYSATLRTDSCNSRLDGQGGEGDVTTRDDAANAAADARSTVELVTSIKDDLTGLVRGEVELAKAEIRESATRAAMGGALGIVAAYLLVLVSILVSVAAAYGLTALGLHPGWAFAIVAGVYLLLAALLGLLARNRLQRVQSPERTKRMVARAGQALRPGNRT